MVIPGRVSYETFLRMFLGVFLWAQGVFLPFFACFSVKIYDGKIKICFLANFSGRILVFFLHLWYDSTMQEKM